MPESPIRNDLTRKAESYHPKNIQMVSYDEVLFDRYVLAAKRSNTLAKMTWLQQWNFADNKKFNCVQNCFSLEHTYGTSSSMTQ